MRVRLRLWLRAFKLVRFDHDQIFRESPAGHREPTGPVHGPSRAVEDEIVVAAELIDRQHRQAVLLGVLRQNLQMPIVLAEHKRARRGIHDQFGSGLNQFSHRVGPARVPIAAPDIIAAPEILADAQANLKPVDFDDSGGVARAEVAVLIEHVIRRQQPLVVPRQLFAVPVHNERIGQSRL